MVQNNYNKMSGSQLNISTSLNVVIPDVNDDTCFSSCFNFSSFNLISVFNFSISDCSLREVFLVTSISEI